MRKIKWNEIMKILSAALDNKPFTRLYAYYNQNAGNNNMIYTISSKLGGECSITLNNTTQYNVELRRDGVYGETIGYAVKGTINTTFSVAANSCRVRHI